MTVRHINAADGDHSRYARICHVTFRAGIIAKGIDGTLDIIGSVLLFVMRPETIGSLVRSLTEHELSTEHRDIFANFLLRSAGHLPESVRLFGALYLLSHGVVKVLLVLSLWKRKLWAYPAAIIFFYHLHRLSALPL